MDLTDPELMKVAYTHLEEVAERWVRRHGSWDVSPQSLVHEAWIKVAGTTTFESRGHFLAVAAKAVRHVLVDRARAAAREKRGGDQVRVTFTDVPGAAAPVVDALAVEQALASLEEAEPRLCQLVELRFFAGSTTEEVAALLGVSTRTVEKDWRKCKAWLTVALADA